jgi:hypothetical protein
MIARVAYPKRLGDDFRHPVRRPHIAPKPIGFGATLQQAGKLRTLLRTQPRRAARRGMARQRGDPSTCARTSQPLADRSFAHAEGNRDVFLSPTLFFEDPGALASLFAPVRFVWCSHTPHAPTPLLLLLEVSKCRRTRIDGLGRMAA